ncbi:major facilitator superfamily domain-containing protein [Plectosphaerella plurivora]|uniref:Major facilitator superfamily domain-containing protein n=1 Tax=Plectosphaerella plurivora TaxID=936078 RepID=A0A9P9A6D0_9PEZI|nr:major facilitator superfamily domain-containing protein [Plectosphaerella plurivora]
MASDSVNIQASQSLEGIQPKEGPNNTSFLISASRKIHKLPIPLTSPRDPLNRTRRTRIAAFPALTFGSTVAFFQLKLPGALMGVLQLEFEVEGANTYRLDLLNPALTLFLSIGYLIASATTTAVGRRPDLLFSCLLTVSSIVSAATTNDFWAFLVSVCVQSLSLGINLSVTLLILLDATFFCERPQVISIYWCVVNALAETLIIPTIYVTDTAANWCPIYQASISPALLSFLGAFLLVPEAFFIRPPVSLEGRLLVQSSSENVKIFDNSRGPIPAQPSSQDTEEITSNLLWQRLKTARAPGSSWAAAGAVCMQMVFCAINPLVVWICLLGATLLSTIMFLGLTQVMELMKAHQGQDLQRVGVYISISGVLSSFLAYPATGPLIDWATRYYAVRNGRARRAEVYLLAFIIPVLAGAISIAAYGLAVLYRWPPIAYYLTYGLVPIF